jgi:hypothetical protein
MPDNLTEHIAESRREFHKDVAKLPFEEKII